MGFPTLHAFVDFICQFDVPNDSTLTNDGKRAIDTGKPFSPTMFDAVLKGFTPDLPAGISGRHRCDFIHFLGLFNCINFTAYFYPLLSNFSYCSDINKMLKNAKNLLYDKA